FEGQCYAALVDADIARALRRAGSWSPARMEAMVDTMVDRRDPDAVRARREKAKRNREFTVEIGRDGLASATDTRPAEDIVALHAAVRRLAEQVCPKDTRSKAAQASDAHYALITQTKFGCDCDRPITDCRYKNIDLTTFAANAPRIVIHLVTDTTTLTGPVPAPENERVCRSPQHLPRPYLNAAAPPRPDAQTDTDEVEADSAANPVSAETMAPESPAPEPVAAGSASVESVAAEPVATETVATEAVPSDRPTVTAGTGDSGDSTELGGAATAGDAADHSRGCEEPVGLDFVDGVGFLPGIGIISGAHVRDLAADPRTIIRPLGDGTDTPLPATQPSNPYRPSAALDAYVRARDLFCTWPGCNRPAWDGDLDHITEYDHTHPEKGGQTSAHGLGAKCRFHHLLKTFGDFVDDQYPDPTDPSRLIRTITIPDGRTVLGPAFTGHDVHPGLDAIVFGDPPTPGKPPPKPTERQRPAPRTEQKHARRRQERNRNRLRRVITPDDTPPPF
ncbi:HNH endonuclease signature motif containing protein, partial [Rhodococcoides kroppenstedtii]|uniref:HNH endonuclease signature motif containing protein n=1 Tax=Rhodococcoides kroppenstedtii TaxID=293050 RepID=UPI0009EF38FC